MVHWSEKLSEARRRCRAINGQLSEPVSTRDSGPKADAMDPVWRRWRLQLLLDTTLATGALVAAHTFLSPVLHPGSLPEETGAIHPGLLLLLLAMLFIWKAAATLRDPINWCAPHRARVAAVCLIVLLSLGLTPVMWGVVYASEKQAGVVRAPHRSPHRLTRNK